MYKTGFMMAFDQRLRLFDDFALRIMRASAALFFIALWIWHLQFGNSFYLTPELKTAAVAVPFLHLAMGLSALSPYTTPLTGIGIFVLFGWAAHDYGVYHLIDYLIFLGIGYFFLAANIQRGQWRK
jgi:hypothetical protein